jgi:hypothetical protein
MYTPWLYNLLNLDLFVVILPVEKWLCTLAFKPEIVIHAKIVAISLIRVNLYIINNKGFSLLIPNQKL